MVITTGFHIGLSRVAERLTASPTLSFDAKAKRRKDVISLAAGQLDFNTPTRIIEEGFKAARAGKTKYTPSRGVPELLNAISIYTDRTIFMKYAPPEIAVTDGAKFGLYAAFRMTINEGDEIIIPVPYWPTYEAQISQLIGGKVVPAQTEAKNSFKMTPDLLLKHITPKTIGFLINSPGNPTGSVYSKAELEPLGQIAIERNLVVYADDCYSQLVYDGSLAAPSIASVPGMKDHAIVFNAASKAFSMTGWRIGWITAPDHVSAKIADFVSQTTSNVSSISQYAIIQALQEEHKELPVWRKALVERRNFVVGQLRSMGLSVDVPQGAFYVFPSISGLNVPDTHVPSDKKGRSALADCFAWGLLNTKNIAIVSGAPFGAPNNIRISYAASEENLAQGMRGMAEYVRGLRGG